MPRRAVTAGPQATFVVEYPCATFCRIEVELVGEHRQTSLQELWERADALHQQEHPPEQSAEPAAAEPEMTQPEPAKRPPATVFRSAPGQGVDRSDQGRPNRSGRSGRRGR